jgi:hypothetical protein
MQPTFPLWLQKFPSDVQRRLELAIASAVEALIDAHAEQALNLVAVLSPRMSFDHAVDRYLEMMELASDEAQAVRTRSLVMLGEAGVTEELERDRRTSSRLNWRYATPLGALRFVRRQLRRSAEEDLWLELSAARSEEALARTHVKHALNFVTILDDHLPPTRAVSLYLEQLEVPSLRARSIYQRALARVASVELPRLGNAGDGSSGSA